MSDNKQSENLWTIVAVLGFIVLLVVGYKIKSSMNANITATAVLDPSCELHKGQCSSELPNGGSVSFSITPNDIPILRPLELNVITKGVEVSKVEVDFVGVDMDMGYNRSTLEKQKGGYFKGKVVIPVCVRSKMDWKAKVLLTTDKGLIMAPFQFYTIK